MFPCLPARATFVADTHFVPDTQKRVSDFFQKHLMSVTNVSRSLAKESITSNDVCATMCTRLFRGVDFGFWSHLGCEDRTPITVSFSIACEKIKISC